METEIVAYRDVDDAVLYFARQLTPSLIVAGDFRDCVERRVCRQYRAFLKILRICCRLFVIRFQIALESPRQKGKSVFEKPDVPESLGRYRIFHAFNHEIEVLRRRKSKIHVVREFITPPCMT